VDKVVFDRGGKKTSHDVRGAVVTPGEPFTVTV
jgi:hypothetical protein